MKHSIERHIIILFSFLVLPVLAIAEPASPYLNPFLAASSYSEVHAAAHYTAIAGPLGPSRRLNADEIQWKPVGPGNGIVTLYSGPYPNGKRVMWLGGYDRVSKLDADTLEVLTTYAIGGNTYYGEEETNRHIENMDKLDYTEMLDYRWKTVWADSIGSELTFYRMINKDNEFYLPYRANDGSLGIRVFGEADITDPASKISLRRDWKLPVPPGKSNIWGMTMTNDGWILIASSDGNLFAVSQDFTEYQTLNLQALSHDNADNTEYFSAFLRNSPTTDDKGGIFIVTRDYMHRIQWTGKRFSLSEADGAWRSPYPNELGIGSGTTPALMGWGSKEDHLVVIADGSHGNNMLAFWRDEIPADWQGIPGYDRRVAGVTPISFGDSNSEKPQVENSIVVYGYGAFLNNFPLTPKNLPEQKSNLPYATKQSLAGIAITNISGYEPLGGTMIRWHPNERKLKTVWTTPINFAMSICTVSGSTEVLYCWGARDGEWTLEGVDWNTGKSAFHYTIGKSQRFNVWAGVMSIAPNGAVDCGCHGGLGIVRINPK